MRVSKVLTCLIILGAAVGINMHAYLYPFETSTLYSKSKSGLSLEDDVVDEVLLPPKVTNIHTYARPLFAKTRRKYETPNAVKVPQPKVVEVKATEPEKEVVEPPVIELLGLQKTPKGWSALVEIQETNLRKWISNGEKINEWELADIDQKGIRLEYKKASHTVLLFKGKEE